MLMLRYRPRSMSSKQQPKMADHSNFTSSKQDWTIPISPFLCSSSFFDGLIKKSENGTLLSPTSILDRKPTMFCLGSPIWYDTLISPKSPRAKTRNQWECLEPRDIGLGVISPKSPRAKVRNQEPRDIGLGVVMSPNDESTRRDCDKPGTRLVLFASHLTVQIPSFSPSRIRSPKPVSNSRSKTRVSRPFESSKATSIFDSIFVEEPCGDNANSIKLQKRTSYSFPGKSTISTDFLSFCFTCKKKLGQGRDVYIYKGAKSFCSKACRSEEMALDANVD